MDKFQPESLMAQVMSNPKYQSITEDLVLRLSREALASGLTGKPAVKFVRNKLHQVGGAYFKKTIDYAQAEHNLAHLPNNLQAIEVREFCRQTMGSHASTAERLPLLETFFHTCLASIAPVTSILDLACGLNPLAIPWMPLAETFQYDACDIYLDMLALINTFFTHFNLNGGAKPCDLINAVPAEQTQVAFVLKSIPCLEQLDKKIAIHLLEGIRAEHILVSFPVHSLGGRKKGMENFYLGRFIEMLAEKAWQVREFHFKTELAFLVTK